MFRLKSEHSFFFSSFHFLLKEPFTWSSPQLHSTTLTKYIFGDKIALTSSTIFFANYIVRLSNYNFGVYPLTDITTNHGNK